MIDDANVVEDAVRQFCAVFAHEPEVAARAPGRVEVIGNHTDYNGGLVIGAAIDRETVAVAARRADGRIRLTSRGSHQIVESTRDQIHPRDGQERWANYPLGVLLMFIRAEVHIDSGFEIAFSSSVPSGAGLSSSAALELATAEALQKLFKQQLDPVSVVRACRRAENEFVGVPSGILDQGVSKFSRRGHVVSIDCREETFNTLPLPEDMSFWVLNTREKHALLDSLYATRHDECMRALAALQKRFDHVEHLTDATPEHVQSMQGELDEVVYRRALHVTSEHERVREALDLLRNGDMETLGILLLDSHVSSRDWFENSTPKLDFLVDELASHDDVMGARLTGGGFGGAVLALTTKNFTLDDAQRTAEAYRAQFGEDVSILHCRTADGAGPMALPPTTA